MQSSGANLLPLVLESICLDVSEVLPSNHQRESSRLEVIIQLTDRKRLIFLYFIPTCVATFRRINSLKWSESLAPCVGIDSADVYEGLPINH